MNEVQPRSAQQADESILESKQMGMRARASGGTVRHLDAPQAHIHPGLRIPGDVSHIQTLCFLLSAEEK